MPKLKPSTPPNSQPRVRDATPPQRQAFSVVEAAQTLGCSRSHLYNLRDRGGIEFRKIGNRTVVTAAEIARLLAA